MSNIYLSEKGFGITSTKGECFVVADQEGEPLTMQLVKFPNGVIGGQIMLINGRPDKRVKSHMPISQKKIFELYLKYGAGFGNVTIRQFINKSITEEMNWACNIMNAAFHLEDNKIEFISSCGMQNSSKAIELLDGILWDALQKAISRSLDPKPSRLYHGYIANDVPMLIRTWYKANKKADVVLVESAE